MAVAGANAGHIPLIIPCHRVIAAMKAGGFSCGLHRKAWLLSHEESLQGLSGAGFSGDGLLHDTDALTASDGRCRRKRTRQVQVSPEAMTSAGTSSAAAARSAASPVSQSGGSPPRPGWRSRSGPRHASSSSVEIVLIESPTPLAWRSASTPRWDAPGAA